MMRSLKRLIRSALPASLLAVVRQEVYARRVLRGIDVEGDVALLPAVVRADHICWDIGAHAGMYVVPLSKLAKHVYAFEPVPSTRRILETVVRRASLANVTISAFAIADTTGEARMEIPVEGIFAGYSIASLDERGSLRVSTATVDDLVTRGWPAPDFIKCDAEGAEGRIVQFTRDWHANRVIEVSRRLGWTRNYFFTPAGTEIPAGWVT